MAKLVLIDGNAIMHRAYHAMPKLTSRSGQPINAVYGFTSMLLKIIEDLKPTHIAVCFDRKEPTFRKKMYEAYQAQRPETDEELTSQFDLAKKVVEAFRIPVYTKAGYEADDLIGTLSEKTKSKLDEIVIVTGDKDQMQLVDERVKVYMPVKGLSDAKLFGPTEVVEKLGVEPKNVIDLKALMGDSSDNYKGVPGIGPVSAEKLIKEYKSYKEIYENLRKIDKATASKLKAGKKSGDISYELAKIVRDVEFKFDLNEMKNWNLGSSKVLDVFDEIGFRTLKKRVQQKAGTDFKNKLDKDAIVMLVVRIAKALEGKQYAIRGTASMVLQGLDMGVEDIDVVADKDTSLLMNELFKKELIEEVKYSESEKYKSYFGKFNLDNVLVEVMGEWQIRVKEHKSGRVIEWGGVYDGSDDEINKIELETEQGDLEIRVSKLEIELKQSAQMGRWSEYQKIKKQIVEKQQGSLF
ncbi:MAG TPA: 5'-3' exonuclease H3TH domain-containing protein [Patescibacteria group bacterium]|nr:5'-3' exonuclease H3TH domain-containing protein [Patescibacteria group bacterium]